MVRKLLALLFIAVIFFNLCGYYFIFLAEQNDLKCEMKSLIHSGKMNEFSEVIITSNPYNDPDFRWNDKNEFLYKGHLYDVISLKASGNNWFITCINDTKEEQLISDYRHYNDLLSESSFPSRPHQSQVLSQLMITSALLTEQAGMFKQQPRDFKFNEYLSDLSFIPITPPTPPPKVS